MTSTEKLDERIEQLKAEGVIDMRIFLMNTPDTKETLAGQILDLMGAETVVDPEMF